MSLEPPEVAIAAMEALVAHGLRAGAAGDPCARVAINSSLGPPVDEARIRKSDADVQARSRIENTGHFLMMEAPERFNPVLLEAIAAIAKPR